MSFCNRCVCLWPGIFVVVFSFSVNTIQVVVSHTLRFLYQRVFILADMYLAFKPMFSLKCSGLFIRCFKSLVMGVPCSGRWNRLNIQPSLSFPNLWISRLTLWWLCSYLHHRFFRLSLKLKTWDIDASTWLNF